MEMDNPNITLIKVKKLICCFPTQEGVSMDKNWTTTDPKKCKPLLRTQIYKPRHASSARVITLPRSPRHTRIFLPPSE